MLSFNLYYLLTELKKLSISYVKYGVLRSWRCSAGVFLLELLVGIVVFVMVTGAVWIGWGRLLGWVRHRCLEWEQVCLVREVVAAYALGEVLLTERVSGLGVRIEQFPDPAVPNFMWLLFTSEAAPYRVISCTGVRRMDAS